MSCRQSRSPMLAWAFCCALSLPTATPEVEAEEVHDSARVHRASPAASIDDLVRRAQLPVAAISPSGRTVAYLSVRGDPVSDTYAVQVRVTDLSQPTDHTLAAYRLAPDEAFDEFENLQP